MQAHQSPSINRQRMVRMLVACFTLTGLFTLVSFAGRGRDSQEVSQIKLSVEDPRPVAKAILVLEEKYGWVINYEDPRYVHSSEVADVTLEVRRDLDKYKPGEAPKVLGPRGGILEFTYDTNLLSNPVIVVQKLLDAQTSKGNGGRFRLESSGQIMYVIPIAIKNSAGELAPQKSALDAIISLPAVERTSYQKLENICAAISRATNIPIELGTIPTNLFYQHRDKQGAASQRARDVLASTFATMGRGANLSWRLLYDPGVKTYALNIHLVSK